MKATIFIDGKRVEIEGNPMEIAELTAITSKSSIPHGFKMTDLFSEKQWVKAYVPYGYGKQGKWLVKNDLWTAAILEIFTIILELKNLTKVAEQINVKYGSQLGIEFDRDNITRIYHDSIYMGSPQYMDKIIQDESLAFVTEEQFRKCEKILETINDQSRSKDYEPFKHHQTTVVQFLLTKVRLVCIDCGNDIVRNGTTSYQGISQQCFKCNGCGQQFRFPTLSQLRESMNGLKPSVYFPQ